MTSAFEPNNLNKLITLLRHSPILFNISPFFFHSTTFEAVDLVELDEADLTDLLSSNCESRLDNTDLAAHL